jgi:tetratricopeptide (TPR) repeat protein
VTAFLCAVAAVPAMAQKPAPASADSTVPLFVVMAAVNAGGYDADLSSARNSPLRNQLRQDIEKAAPPCLRDLRVFYAARRNPNPVRDLSQFISFALLIGGPPDFAFRVREDELPAEGIALRDLRPLLAALYKEARLDQLWEKYRPAYERELSRYDDGLARVMLEVNGYLRITSSGFLGRSFSIYVDLLGAPGQVNARSFGPDYYVVSSTAAQPQLDQVRHGYLHYVLEPMAVKDSTLVRSKATLGEFAETAQALDPVLRGNFRLLLTESLIRAAELRMSPLSPVARQQKLQDILSEGLILAPYFYEALEQFEKQDAGMRIYYPEMIDKMEVRREEKRLANVTFRTPSPGGSGAPHLTVMEAAPAQAPRPAAEAGKPSGPAAPGAGSEEEKLLAQAEDALARQDFAAARQSFQQALEKEGLLRDHAIYGLALVASQEKQPELAKNYFQQALDISKSPRLLAWSHIYLGRILDMEQNRELALQHYRQALVTSEEPVARQAAERGLQAPFRRESK